MHGTIRTVVEEGDHDIAGGGRALLCTVKPHRAQPRPQRHKRRRGVAGVCGGGVEAGGTATRGVSDRWTGWQQVKVKFESGNEFQQSWSTIQSPPPPPPPPHPPTDRPSALLSRRMASLTETDAIGKSSHEYGESGRCKGVGLGMTDTMEVGRGEHSDSVLVCG